MIYTNRYNIPEPICKAIDAMGYDIKPDINIISANALVDSPRRRILTIRHYDEIEVDYSWRLWEFLGNACHLAMEKGATKTLDAITERRIYMRIMGKTLTGKPDWVEPSKALLLDHKVTRTYAFILERAFEKWEAVLNVYIFMLRRKGIKIDKAMVNGILRDWDISLTYKKDMPDVPFMQKEINIWDEEKQYNYIIRRITIHKSAEIYKDEDLPLCTLDERWAEPERYAVYKEGAKHAYRVYGHEFEANETARLMSEKKKTKYIVVKRDAVSKRCDPRYCYVAPFCNYYKSLNMEAKDEGDVS